MNYAPTKLLKQRAVSALVVHQTDPEQPPFRKPLVSAFWGLGLALVGLTIAGVLAMFNHSSALTIKDGENVLMDEKSGALFVKLDGLIRSVPNSTSAYLALGKYQPTLGVSGQQLVGLKRGHRIGILDAPAEPPTSSQLLKDPWAMCSQPKHNSAGAEISKSVLLVGGKTPPRSVVAGQRAILVKAADHEALYMIWNGYRYRLATPAVDLAALNRSAADAIPVSSAWLNTVPTGADIRPIKVPNIGAASSVLSTEQAGVASGQIFRVAPAQYYLVSGNKLRQISEFQALLQRADPATQEFPYGGQQPRFRKLNSIAAQRAKPKMMHPAADADPPAALPTFVPVRTPTVSVCASFAPGGAVPSILVGSRIPSGGATVGGSAHGTPLADRVVVPAGQGALIRILGNQDKSLTGTLALVTDDGRLFPLASTDVVAMLGYGNTHPISITAALATRLPRGPVLDPTVAKQPY